MFLGMGKGWVGVGGGATGGLAGVGDGVGGGCGLVWPGILNPKP